MAYYRTGPAILQDIAGKFSGTCYVAFVTNVGETSPLGKIPIQLKTQEIEFNEPKEEVINGIRGFKLTSKNKVVFPKPGVSIPGISHIQIFSSSDPSDSDLLASMPVLGYDSRITIAPNEERVIEEIEIDLW